MAKKIAVYAGSFDPPTLGHLDVIRRAAAIFDQVIVVVGYNAKKGRSALFSPKERVALIASMHSLSNVKTTMHDGLIVDFAKKAGAKFLIRGLRGSGDFAYEWQMVHMNRALAPQLETVLIAAEQNLAHISSSLVKEVATHGGDTRPFVTPRVFKLLAERIAKE